MTVDLDAIDDDVYEAVVAVRQQQGVAVIRDIALYAGIPTTTCHRAIRRLVDAGRLAKLGTRAGWVPVAVSNRGA